MLLPSYCHPNFVQVVGDRGLQGNWILCYFNNLNRMMKKKEDCNFSKPSLLEVVIFFSSVCVFLKSPSIVARHIDSRASARLVQACFLTLWGQCLAYGQYAKETCGPPPVGQLISISQIVIDFVLGPDLVLGPGTDTDAGRQTPSLVLQV